MSLSLFSLSKVIKLLAGNPSRKERDDMEYSFGNFHEENILVVYDLGRNWRQRLTEADIDCTGERRITLRYDQLVGDLKACRIAKAG